MMRTLMRKELREQIRTYRLVIMVSVLVVLGLISPLGAKYLPLLLRSIPGAPAGLETLLPEPKIVDAFVQYIKNLSQLGLILVIILNMGSIAQEVERGTAAMMVVKPVRRSTVILAKWLAAVISLSVGMLLAALGCAFYTLVLFEPFSIADFLVLNGLLWVYLVFFTTLALLASALARTQASAAALAFGALFLALILDIFPGIGNYMAGELTAWAGTVAGGSAGPNWPALIVCLSSIIILLAAAMVRFSKEEL